MLTLKSSSVYLTLCSCLLIAATSVRAQSPVINTPPQSQTAVTGSNVIFSVQVGDSSATLPNISSGTLRLWLKADAGVVTNSSGRVNRWQDQSGNANDALQATANLQPLITVPGNLNGKPAVRFAANPPGDTSGTYLHGTGDVGIPNVYTAFMVYQTREITNNDIVVAYVGVPGTYGSCRGFDLAQQQLCLGTWTYDYFTAFAPAINTPRLWTERFNTNLNSAQVFDYSASSTTNFSFSTSGQSAPAPGYYLGGLDPSGQFVVSGRNFNGDIAELIYFQGALTEGDRATVQQYLAQKYLLPSSQGPFTYQWRMNGGAIGGATDSSLNLTNVQIAASGTYSVVVSNSIGSTTSSPAVLTVGDAPAITTQPQSQTVIQGTPTSFSVSASGTAPLSYTWVFNGSVIPGATTATLSITNVQFSNVGSYSVVASSPFGQATSGSATLSVETVPVIGNQPQSQILFKLAATQFLRLVPRLSPSRLCLMSLLERYSYG